MGNDCATLGALKLQELSACGRRQPLAISLWPLATTKATTNARGYRLWVTGDRENGPKVSMVGGFENARHVTKTQKLTTKDTKEKSRTPRSARKSREEIPGHRLQAVGYRLLATASLRPEAACLRQGIICKFKHTHSGKKTTRNKHSPAAW
jgi:hypothetical protein